MRTALTTLFVAIAAFSAEPTVDSLIENGHWKRARELAQASFKAHPEDPRANYILAKIQHAFGNRDEAAKLAEAAVRLDPKMSAAHRELPKTSTILMTRSSTLWKPPESPVATRTKPSKWPPTW